jgi:hypothetical protein
MKNQKSDQPAVEGRVQSCSLPATAMVLLGPDAKRQVILRERPRTREK